MWRWLLSVLAGASLLSACGSGASGSSQPTSTLGKLAATMLADGTVSDLELSEARQLVVDCLAGRGWVASYDNDTLGVRSATSDSFDDDALDRDVTACEEPVLQVFFQYSSQTDVPRDEFQAALAQCLFEAGLLDVPELPEGDGLQEIADRHPDEFERCRRDATGD